MYDKLVFHIDVNSAFLSWEATERVKNGLEDLRLIPSCIGGDVTSRTGIVVAKSIPAKKYGINTGEPMAMALRKCPSLISVKPNFDLYVRYSKAFKSICKEYTPCMQSFSIDEVFLDMSGMKNIYPDPIATAYEIKDRIKNELGFTVNVGIGVNKLCAKMASDFTKPDKVHTLFLDEIESKMWPLEVGELFTCGKASTQKLNAFGIKTIGDLANTPIQQIINILGDKQGKQLHEFANGIDDDKVIEEDREAKGYSAETTLEENLTQMSEILKILMAQVDVVSARMRADDGRCRCIAVTYKTHSFRSKSHQKKIQDATDVTEIIYGVVKELISECWAGEPIRLIGVSLSDIVKDEFEQLSLFDDGHKEKLKKLDTALDSLRGRFGDDIIKRASIIDVNGKINRRHKAENRFNLNNENDK